MSFSRNYNDTNVDKSTLDDDQTDVQENNNDADLDYKQQHDFVQEHYTNDQLAISDNVISNGTAPVNGKIFHLILSWLQLKN